MAIRTFEKSILLPSAIDKVFAFHACMQNIIELVPEHVRVEILDAPCHIAPGTMIYLRVYLRSVSFRWEAKITQYRENKSFTDELQHGPFSYWKHEHIFTPKRGKTLMTDKIEYRVGFSIFGGFASHFIVQRELENIFASRHNKALEFFGGL